MGIVKVLEILSFAGASVKRSCTEVHYGELAREKLKVDGADAVPWVVCEGLEVEGATAVPWVACKRPEVDGANVVPFQAGKREGVMECG